MEALVMEYAKRYGMQKAIEYFGLDKQTQNPKYAISLGGMSYDPVNAAKRAVLNTGLKSAFSGNLSGIMGPAALMGGALLLGRAFDPMRPGSKNYSPNLRGQVDFLSRQDGMLSTNPGTGGLVYGPNSVLAGQNVSSMFGTNNYQKQLDKKIGYFEKRIALGKKINEEKYEVAKKENTSIKIKETLKWGEPSYLTKNGSTLRIDWKKTNPNHYSMYFNCKTKLIITFKELFSDKFDFVAN